MTRSELENRIVALLGGRAAEKVLFDHLSTGAADDLAKVIDIARSMVMRFGMDERLGHVSYDTGSPSLLGQQSGQTVLERRYSESTAMHIDAAVKRIVDDAYARAVDILNENRTLLNEGTRMLLIKETLVESEIRELTKDLHPVRPPAPLQVAAEVNSLESIAIRQRPRPRPKTGWP